MSFRLPAMLVVLVLAAVPSAEPPKREYRAAFGSALETETQIVSPSSRC